MTCEVSTPPCIMRSSTSQPRSLIGSAVTRGGALAPALPHGARDVVFAAAFPHLELRALRTRPKPGSKRSITSPKEAQSQRRLRGRPDLQTLSVSRSAMVAQFPRMVLMSCTVSRTRASMPS